jgi:hypothetical protein
LLKIAFRKHESCRRPPILTGALSRIEEGLSVYPREPRLIQIQETVQRDLQTQRRQTRRRDLDELRRMESEVDGAADDAAKQALGSRLQTMVAKYSTDGEVLTIANGLLHRLGLLDATRNAPIPAPENESATLTYHTPAPPQVSPSSLDATSNFAGLPEVEASVVVPPPAAAAPPPPNSPIAPTVKISSPTPQPKPSTPVQKRDGKPARPSMIAIVAAAAAIILLAAIFLFVRKHRATQAETTAAPVVQPAAPVQPSPEPNSTSLRLSSDTGTGKVTLDTQPPVEFQDGQWSADKLAKGEHQLRVEGTRGEASFAFSTDANSSPVVDGTRAQKSATQPPTTWARSL